MLIALFLILYCRGCYFCQSVLEKLKRLRAGISEIAKDFAKRANMAEHAQEANDLLEEGMKQLENLLESAVRLLLEWILVFNYILSPILINKYKYIYCINIFSFINLY